MAEDHGNDIAMIVESVRVHMPTGRHVLLLKEIGLGRILPIWIGPWEASAIAAHLQGVEPERPLTHDLFARVLREMGARMDRVLISRLAEDTFHARMVLVTADTRHEVDARPTDGPGCDAPGRGGRRRDGRDRRPRGTPGTIRLRGARVDRRAHRHDTPGYLPGVRELPGP